MKKLPIFALFFLISYCVFCEDSLLLTEPEVGEPSQTTEVTEPSQTTANEEITSAEETNSAATEIVPNNEITADTEPEAGEPSRTTEMINPPSITGELISLYADRPEVEDWRNYYLTEKGSKLLYDILENAMTYRLYVRKVISERELPVELEYLPVVESGYKTSAKSKSGAMGMWQFMANSVKPFMTLNEYVDERLDPWKSTEAGLSKLTDNYNYFGDWLIAIAAYNCGVGAMNKAIKRGGSNDFWYLAENGFLSNQTKDYVPKLIAVSDLAINSEKYNINLPDHKTEYELLINEREGSFDYISVKAAYSISELAREMRIDEKNLKKLNPALIKGFTPPATEYKIRVPLGMAETAKTALEAIQPLEFPFKYKVVQGDSLWSISRKFGVSIQEICDLNGIEENAILRIGKILYIPSAN